MKMSSLAYLILAVSVCVPIAVDAVPTGSVCIPAFPKTSGGELPMTQGYISPSQVSIQIGSQKPVVISKQVGNNAESKKLHFG